MGVSPDMEIALPVSPVLAPAATSPPLDWETTLVRGCQQGDPDAFRLLVERYQGKVFSIAYALVRRRPDVEDIAQQVFTKVYFGIRHFDFRSAFLTWLYKITVNECYDFLRKQRSNRMVCLSEMSEEEARQFTNRRSGDILPDRQAELAQMTALLLKKVPEEERLLLLLREVEGYSIYDLSRMFGWNENTVKVKLFRARQRLVKIAKRHSLSQRERRDHAATR